MRKTWLLAIVLAVGCHDASKDVAALADRACACKDKACADKVLDDLVEFAKNNKNAKGDEDKAMKEMKRMVDCAVTAGADMSTVAKKLQSLAD